MKVLLSGAVGQYRTAATLEGAIMTSASADAHRRPDSSR